MTQNKAIATYQCVHMKSESTAFTILKARSKGQSVLVYEIFDLLPYRGQ